MTKRLSHGRYDDDDDDEETLYSAVNGNELNL